MTTSPGPSSSSSASTSEQTPFRRAEKHFKSRRVAHTTPTLLPGTLDVSRPENREDDEVWQSGWWGPEEDEMGVRYRRRKGKERARGERREDGAEGLKVIETSDGRHGYVVAEGCVLIPRYLDAERQLRLLESALSEYTRPPNPLSLSTHYDLPPDLFNLYAHAPDTRVPTLFSSLSAEDQAAARARESRNGQRKVNETQPGSVLGYEEILERGKGWTGDVPGSKLGEKSADELVRELRWANLGWVYRWTTKSYDFSTDHPIPFPDALADTCQDIVSAIKWGEVLDSGAIEGGTNGQESDGKLSEREWETWRTDYRPDTGIVNFYQMKDTLMGHVDRAELDPSRPLVSISLGHAAIFLLGSATRDEAPRPIILRSGDALVMAGKGRQAYHGIPRIMEGTLPAHFQPDETDGETRRAVKRYISTARVNINARQVFPPGFERPQHRPAPST